MLSIIQICELVTDEAGMKGHLIASTGGKGGTGKSTFAVLLALKLSKRGEKVVLCDCDVECPNDYLLLNLSLIHI